MTSRLAAAFSILRFGPERRPRSRARAAALALAAALLAGAPSPAAAGIFDPKTFTLANGLQVVVIPSHRVPVVTHMVWYKVGAADEPAGKSGIAHFLEHMMFKGTERIAPGEFSRIVARNGGEDNAFTSQDYTAYYQRVARDRLPLVMELEADRMANLRITGDQVIPERAVVLEERRSRVANNPSALMSEALQASLFYNSPYGRPVIGWAPELESLGTADAESFYRRYYVPNNAILVVAGDVTAEELRPLAEEYYGPVAAGDVPPRVRPPEPDHHAAGRVVLEDPRVGQPALTRAYLAPSHHAGESGHAYALEVLAEVLGGGTTSRLYRALVVEQSVAAGIHARYDPDSVGRTQFTVYASPVPGVSLDELEAALDRELRRLLEDGLAAEEVEKAKDRLQADAIYARDSTFTPARIFGSALATGGTVEDVEAWPERIAKVAPGEVEAAARAVLRIEESVTGRLVPRPAS